MTIFTGNPDTDCASVTVVSGQLNCITTVTTTITENVTDVTFVDEAVVEAGEVRELIALLSDFPTIVMDLETLLPNSLSISGLTRNQRAVADALNIIASQPGFDNSPIRTVFDEIAALSPAEQAAALDQLHPEPYDALTEAGINASSQFHRTIRDRIRTRVLTSRESGAPASQEASNIQALTSQSVGSPQGNKRGGVWGEIQGGRTDRDGRSGQIDYDSNTYSIQAGVDRSFSNGALVGVSAAYSHVDIDVDSRANGDADIVTGGVYGAYTANNITVDAGIGVAHVNADLTRRVAFGAIDERPSGDLNWNQVSGHVQVSTTHEVRGITLRPYAGAEAVAWDGDSLRETGGGAVGLSVKRENDARVTGLAGIEVGSAFTAAPGWTLAPSIGVGIRHHFTGADRSLSASFREVRRTGLPPLPHEPTRTRPPFDVSLDLTAIGTESGTRLTVGYYGSFSDDTTSHTGSLRLIVPF